MSFVRFSFVTIYNCLNMANNDLIISSYAKDCSLLVNWKQGNDDIIATAVELQDHKDNMALTEP